MLKQRFLFQNSLFLCWQRKPSSDWFRAVNWLHFITCPLPSALKSCRHVLGLYYARQGVKPHKSLPPSSWTFFLILQMVGLSVADSLPKWQRVPWWGRTHIFWEGCELEEKQVLDQKGLPGKASRRVCQGRVGLFPWVSRVAAVQQGRRGEEREKERFSHVWHLAGTMMVLRAGQEDVLLLHLLSKMRLHLRSRACKRSAGGLLVLAT